MAGSHQENMLGFSCSVRDVHAANHPSSSSVMLVTMLSDNSSLVSNWSAQIMSRKPKGLADHELHACIKQTSRACLRLGCCVASLRRAQHAAQDRRWHRSFCFSEHVDAPCLRPQVSSPVRMSRSSFLLMPCALLAIASESKFCGPTHSAAYTSRSTAQTHFV